MPVAVTQPEPSSSSSSTSGPPTKNTPIVPAEQEVNLSEYDEEQVRLMEERCILVTPDDVAYGEGSKKDCHLMSNINTGLLHRAFSVFLFHPLTGKLLLQKRADEKITFPSMWTNTCCSHPLSIKSELVEEGEKGVRAAAIRKLPHELGVAEGQLEQGDFTYLTKIHYLAPSSGVWGEHEVDYILFASKHVTLELNPNEVSDARYVSEEELKVMFADETNLFTPWFRLICRDLLFPWWSLMLSRSRDRGWAPPTNEEDGTGGSGVVDAKLLQGERQEGVRRMI